MVRVYRKSVAALIYQMAQDDPELVKAVIKQLRESGEIDKDDLRHVERLADRWIAIARANAAKARR